MNEFLKTLLSLSLSGMLLFLLVLLPRGLYRERFSRRWQYYIFLVVALRFLLPFAPGVTFTGYLFERIETALPDSEGNAAPGESGSFQAPDSRTDHGSETPDGLADKTNGSPTNQADSDSSYPGSLADFDSNHPEEPANHGSTALARPTGTRHAKARTINPGTDAVLKGTDSTAVGHKDSDSRMVTANRQSSSHSIGTNIASLLASLRNLPYFYTGLFLLWLTAATGLLIRKATAYQSFLGFLKASSAQISDIETLNLLSDCKDRLHIRGKVELYTNPLIGSPILTGFFRPRIILPCPRNQEPEQPAPAATQQPAAHRPGIRKTDLSHIFTHELIHHKRRDMFYKWFLQVILCVHWFNPFVYLLNRETARACELACDESVVASLDDAGKKAYGNTLIASLQTQNTYKSPRPSVTLTESAEELKERLGAIMKSHKKTKSAALLTALATAAVCIAFGTLGAYAQPATDNPAKNAASAPNRTEHSGNTESLNSPEPPAADNTPDNGSSANGTDSLPDGASYQQDGNIYYIYTEGTNQSEKPLVGFTDGTIGVVLVGQDRYISLGPFDQSADAEDFLEEISQICQDMTDSGKITQKDTQVILALAEIIKDRFPDPAPSGNVTSGYTFVQRGYYQDSFIIELGWNLPAGGQVISQAKRITATLKDGSRLSVYFADTAREYAHDSEALAAIGNLIDSLREKNLKGYPNLETPLVSRIRKVDGSDLPSLAKEYIADEDLSGFSAVFPVLDAASQEECCRILYEEYNTSFFVSIVPFLEEDMLLSFLDRADEDGNISFFFALLLSGYVPTEQISENYAEKYYENDNIASFTAIVCFLSEEDQRRFLERAEHDYKPAFYQAIIGAISQSAFSGRNSAGASSNAPTASDSQESQESQESQKSQESQESRDSRDSGSIAYEGADILHYENGAPYLRGILANYTDRTITEAEYCILAYDRDGQPLQLRWNLLDSSADAAYDNLVRRSDLRLLPGQTTEDIPGGWSLSEEDAAKISYVIYCLKEAAFEDGTVWSNPDYAAWQKAYVGKEIDTAELEIYYPNKYAIQE